MKKNRRNNSRPAAIATAKDTTKAIETRAGVLKEAEDVKKEAKTSFYLQYMGKEISTEEITKKVHEVWTKEYGTKIRGAFPCVWKCSSYFCTTILQKRTQAVG